MKKISRLIFIVETLASFAVSIQAQTLSTWAPATSYPTSITEQSCAVNSGYIYCVGGYDNNGVDTNALWLLCLYDSVLLSLFERLLGHDHGIRPPELAK